MEDYDAVMEFLQSLRLETDGEYHTSLIVAKSGDRLIGGMDLEAQLQLMWWDAYSLN